ncbi:ribonuclease H-like domain-containing protein [Tanacetum coccineum]|uniref:Ribonuclease H-like domain-containing protein n=1 Tax=Tanacetum coccineum TaxID=301880 RepID=A0ABQ5DKP2_9ASTR
MFVKINTYKDSYKFGDVARQRPPIVVINVTSRVVVLPSNSSSHSPGFAEIFLQLLGYQSNGVHEADKFVGSVHIGSVHTDGIYNNAMPTTCMNVSMQSLVVERCVNSVCDHTGGSKGSTEKGCDGGVNMETPQTIPKLFASCLKPNGRSDNVINPEQVPKKVNFRALVNEEKVDNAHMVLPRSAIDSIKNSLQKLMRNDAGVFIFKLSTKSGLEQVLERGPWIIRNSSIILNKWTPYLSLALNEATKVPVWVKLYNIPLVAYSEDGHIGYARALVEINADIELKKEVIMAVPKEDEEEYTREVINVEYELKPPCIECKTFGHSYATSPKNVKKSDPINSNADMHGDGFTKMSSRKKNVKNTSTKVHSNQPKTRLVGGNECGVSPSMGSHEEEQEVGHAIASMHESSKLNAMWKQFDALIDLPRCTCHAADDFKKHNQLMKLMQFLMGLDDTYMQIRTLLVPLRGKRNQALAFVSNMPNRGNFQRNKTSNSGPRPNNVNNNRQGGGSGLVCEHYGFNGHTIDRWANQHMTHIDKEFDNVYDISHLRIEGEHPNRTEAFISKIENLKLSNGLVLYDVLVIPEYCVNIISVHKLAKDNKIFVAFDKSKCYFLNQDLNLRNVLGIGNQCEGLYYFNNQAIKNNLSNSNYQCFLSQHDWHCRLGHPTDLVLNVLKHSLQFDNKRAKQSREPFPLSDHTSKVLGDLVHLDILGPYKVTSSEGYKYFLTIVDDYTRAVWVYLIKSKDEGYRLYSLARHQFIFSRAVKFFESIFPFKDSFTKKTSTTTNVFQDLNHINFFDSEYPELPNDDERVDPSLNSDQKSQSDSSHSFMPGEDVNIVDFPSGNSGNDAQSSVDIFVAQVEQLNKNCEPKTFYEASKFTYWTDAMNNKMDALLRNDTWGRIELSKDRKAIGSKWVFEIKYKSSGEIDRYKERLVAKGNYGVTCEDEAKRRNSGTKTKTFKEDYYLLLYAVSNKEDTAYQRQLITRIREMIIHYTAYHSSPVRRMHSWSSVKDTQVMADSDDTKNGNEEHTNSPMIIKSKLEIGDEFLKILQDNAFDGMNGGDVTDHIAKFDNYWEINKNTKNGLWEFYMNERTKWTIGDFSEYNDQCMDNTKKTCSETFYKPYLDMQDANDIYEVIDREYSPIPIPARRDINNPDELCRTEEFTVVRHSIGNNEEFVTVSPSNISTVERTHGSINYGVTCEDEAKRRNSGTKTKTFEEDYYLLLYAVSNKEDTAYQRQLITRIRVMINSLYGVSLFTYTPYAQLVISQRYAVNVIDGN